MKITIERAALLRSLGHVQSVVERRNTIPILSNVLLSAENGRLSLTTTDMDLEIIDSVEADISEEGALTAPAHTLHDIVRKLPDGAQVELDSTTNSGFLTLRSGRSKFRLGMLPIEDYPRMSVEDLGESFSLSADILKKMIDYTRFAISTEETRYYLNGIYLHETESENGQVLCAVATDGHRLARAHLPLPSGAAGFPNAIIPRKTIGEIRKLADDGGENIRISASETKIRFEFDTVTVTSKLIDGTFPDYTRVIPTGNNNILQIDPKILASAVDRVATISTEKSRAIKLSLDGENLTLSSNSPEHGSATEELQVDYNGDAMEVGFNSRYLLDITAQIDGSYVEIAFSDPASPTLLRDSAGLDALFVLMPMRV